MNIRKFTVFPSEWDAFEVRLRVNEREVGLRLGLGLEVLVAVVDGHAVDPHLVGGLRGLGILDSSSVEDELDFALYLVGLVGL